MQSVADGWKSQWNKKKSAHRKRYMVSSSRNQRWVQLRQSNTRSVCVCVCDENWKTNRISNSICVIWIGGYHFYFSAYFSFLLFHRTVNLFNHLWFNVLGFKYLEDLLLISLNFSKKPYKLNGNRWSVRFTSNWECYIESVNVGPLALWVCQTYTYVYFIIFQCFHMDVIGLLLFSIYLRGFLLLCMCCMIN